MSNLLYLSTLQAVSIVNAQPSIPIQCGDGQHITVYSYHDSVVVDNMRLTHKYSGMSSIDNILSTAHSCNTTRVPHKPNTPGLTERQHRQTMTRACNHPAMPTIHVSRRKRITPRMFWRQGRYTPIRVPISALFCGVRREKREGEGGRGKGIYTHTYIQRDY